jgi:hypothetical protein
MQRATSWMRAICVTMTLSGVVLGSSDFSRAADDGVRSINRCQTLFPISRRSIVLATDLLAPGGDCLVIESSNITLDLNGFTIRSTTGTGFGIVANGSTNNITITNGIVENFRVGISLAGSGNQVENVRVQNNRDTGLFLGAGSLASQVVAQGNFVRGIQMSTAGRVKDSTIHNNGNSADSVALSAGPGSTLSDNTVWQNIGTGITSSLGSTVRGNTAVMGETS